MANNTFEAEINGVTSSIGFSCRTADDWYVSGPPVMVSGKSYSSILADHLPDAAAAERECWRIARDGYQGELTTDLQDNSIKLTREAWIPSIELSTFKSRVELLNKRAVKLSCSPIVYEVTPDKRMVHVPAEQIGGPTGPVNPAYSYETTKILITGETPKLNGYVVAGKIDHDPAMKANIMLELNGISVPAHYRNAPCNCEHCNVKRNRTKTFILQDTKNGSFKQIGSSCLEDYTGHQDPEWACKVAMFINEAIDDLSEPMTRGSLETYTPVEPYLNQVAELVLREGYVSATKAEEQMRTCTADDAFVMFMHQGEDRYSAFASGEKAMKLTADTVSYLKALQVNEDSDNYLKNLVNFVESGIFKEKYRRVVASAIPYYLHHMQKEQEHKEAVIKAHIGTEGEKVTFSGTINKIHSFDSQFGLMRIYAISDDKGNSIVWKSGTLAEVEMGKQYEITATVKKHSIYNDAPQTEILRPKFALSKESIFAPAVLDEIKEMAKPAEGLRGMAAIDKLLEHYPLDQPDLYKQCAGLSNAYVYINSEPTSKNGKLFAEMNATQLLLTSKAIYEAGYHNNCSNDSTSKFIKNNQELVAAIASHEQPEKKAKIKRPRRAAELSL
jgi:hypothetical protein